MRVHVHAAYIQGEFQMRRDDWDAQKYIKALKGDPIKGYANLTIDRVTFRINEASSDAALDFFAFWAVREITNTFPDGKVCLVPVPNKSALVGSNESFRTLQLAERVARRLPARLAAVPCLRWASQLEKARAGGTRNTKTLVDNLRYVGPELDDRLVVLIDDAFTTGSSLRACAQVLASHGVTVQAAFCAGKTVYEQVPLPFRLEPFDLSLTDFSSLDDLSAFLQ